MTRTDSLAPGVLLSSAVLFLALAPALSVQAQDREPPGATGFPMGDVAPTVRPGPGPLRGGNVFTGALGPTVIGGETYASSASSPTSRSARSGWALTFRSW